MFAVRVNGLYHRSSHVMHAWIGFALRIVVWLSSSSWDDTILSEKNWVSEWCIVCGTPREGPEQGASFFLSLPAWIMTPVKLRCLSLWPTLLLLSVGVATNHLLGICTDFPRNYSSFIDHGRPILWFSPISSMYQSISPSPRSFSFPTFFFPVVSSCFRPYLLSAVYE